MKPIPFQNSTFPLSSEPARKTRPSRRVRRVLLTLAVAAGLVTPALAIDVGPPSTPDLRDTAVEEATVEETTVEETVPDRTQSVAEESDGPAAKSPPAAEDSPVPLSDPEAAWGITLAPVPDLLRAHLPRLRFAEGRVVTAVDASGPAAKFGIRRFDVLLEVNGIPLARTERLGEPDDIVWMTVLRRGRVTPLALGRGPGGHASRARHGAARPFSPALPIPPAPRFPAPEFGAPEFGAPFGFPHAANPFPGAASAIASASSTANGAMSVSRVGDQISVEFVSPATDGRRVRLRGTVAEIEAQMETQGLSQAARREVRDALGTP